MSELFLEAFDITTLFDVVIAKDILEHLFNVNAGVAKIVSIMKPAGMLCGAVPLWNVCDCDAHLHHFSVDSLRLVLERFFHDVGVSVVDLTGENENHIRFTCRLPKQQELDDAG